MGSIWSNQNRGENADTSAAPRCYFYPPKYPGRYFGTTFIMGNDKFEKNQDDSYQFGDNFDLNFLGGRPNPFPYVAPFPNEPMQMLKCLINIRKETLKLINPDTAATDDTADDRPAENVNYGIEFIFDSDVDCAITVYFLCKEDISQQGVKYIPKDASHRSETYHYKAGIGQHFSQTSPLFNPQNYNISDLLYDDIDEYGEFNSAAPYPVVISCVAEQGDEPRQSHALIATIEKVYDQIFTMKPLKRKFFVDGLTYLLQEIYGIENKVSESSKTVTATAGGTLASMIDDDSDKSFECVICMSDLRDTMILPCRHLCLCNNCADSLRYQANNCPICRNPFRALLQIKAVKRSSTNASNTARGTLGSVPTTVNSIGPTTVLSDSLNDVMIDIPPGYEPVPLVEALNGITTSSVTIPSQALPSIAALRINDETDALSNKKKCSPHHSKDEEDIENLKIETDNQAKTSYTNKSNNETDEVESVNSSFKAPGTSEDSASASSSLSGNTQTTEAAVQQQEKMLLLAKNSTSGGKHKMDANCRSSQHRETSDRETANIGGKSGTDSYRS